MHLCHELIELIAEYANYFGRLKDKYTKLEHTAKAYSYMSMDESKLEILDKIRNLDFNECVGWCECLNNINVQARRLKYNHGINLYQCDNCYQRHDSQSSLTTTTQPIIPIPKIIKRLIKSLDNYAILNKSYQKIKKTAKAYYQYYLTNIDTLYRGIIGIYIRNDIRSLLFDRIKNNERCQKCKMWYHWYNDKTGKFDCKSEDLKIQQQNLLTYQRADNSGIDNRPKFTWTQAIGFVLIVGGVFVGETVLSKRKA